MNKYKTEQRKKILDFFQGNYHQSLSAQDIYESLRNDDVSMSAIYRNLTDMEIDGLICKVSEIGKNGVYYQYIHPNKCVGSIHLKCKNCNMTMHLNQHIAQMMINYAKDEHGFSINQIGSFLYGTCANCSQL